MVLIAITGTPGVGKSYVAEYLSTQVKGGVRLDLHPHYALLSSSYDRSGRCYNLDFARVRKFVASHIKGRDDEVFFLDSHIAHRLPSALVDFVVVLTCSELDVISSRLKDRRYPKAKIAENLECEMFHVCEEEAFRAHNNVVSVDVTRAGYEKKVLGIVKKFLKGRKR